MAGAAVAEGVARLSAGTTLLTTLNSGLRVVEATCMDAGIRRTEAAAVAVDLTKAVFLRANALGVVEELIDLTQVDVLRPRSQRAAGEELGRDEGRQWSGHLYFVPRRSARR